jgi:N-acetylneuraminic acid mutarotase
VSTPVTPPAPETPVSPAPPVAPALAVHVDGAVQKGPFLVGSTVLINRRDERGRSTSATLLSEIEDSIGSFSFDTNDPGLVQIVATGYYFSELTGQVSNSTLTLRALLEIDEQPGQKAYVNIMTHLINDRVLALLAGGQIGINEAIAQAESELITAFRDALPVTSLEGFSGLSVYNTGTSQAAAAGNAYLLALSTGFYKFAEMKAQEFGTSTDAELTLILNRLSDDLEDDGRLSTPNFIREFTTAIRSLSPGVIAANLRNRAIVDYPAGLDVPDISVFLNLCAGTFDCVWRAAAPLPQETESHSAAVHEGKVYLFGGGTSAEDHCAGGPCIPFYNAYDDAYEYDPAANRWQPLAPIPVGMSRLDAHTIGHAIFVVAEWAVTRDAFGNGSKGMSNRLFAYDPAADRWTEKKPRPTYRDSFVSAVIGGKLYVIGGSGRPDNGPPENFSETHELKAHVEIYDPASDSWSSGRPAPVPSAGQASCVLNGSIYIFGAWAQSGWDSSIAVYDVAADQWSVKSPLPMPPIADRECVPVGGRAYLFGGQERLPSFLSGETDRVDIYDPLVETWSFDETRLPTARFDASTALVGSEVFVLGGRGADFKITNVVEVLDVAALEDDTIP